MLHNCATTSRRSYASCTGFRCASESTSNSAVWCTSRCLGKLLRTWRMTFSLSLTADDVGCDLPVTEPVSFHGPTTFSAIEASLLLDPKYGMLYPHNSDTTSALDFLGAIWSRICLSRALNHGILWHIVSLRLRNILTYLLTYLKRICDKRTLHTSRQNLDTVVLFLSVKTWKLIGKPAF